jgi:glutamine synthetase
MPKPLFGDNGSGMHVHQSLWKDGSPLFYDEKGYAGLSDLARHYVGGILHHAPSLLAFTNPTVNSYHRLVPGFEAPINLVYSGRNRSAAVRIPVTGNNAKAKRLEFRAPDSSGNPYLAFAAMMMAGLDGIRKKTEPMAPVDKDLYELAPEEAKDIPQAPTSLASVIDRLEDDHEYLTEGGVFTEDLIDTWITIKRDNEIAPVNLRPHPYEFELYFDV